MADENLLTLRSKLKDLVFEIEGSFKEELTKFRGNVNPFLKISDFIKKIFGK